MAYLASVTGDLASAEDALSEAFLAALRTWPDRGVPDRPDAWLVTAARRSLVDASRRRAVAVRALPELSRLADEHADAVGRPVHGIPDKRLELMLACTHPAIDASMHSPLMLQVVLGLDAARIAGAFLVPAATMSQRLVRAKTKVRDAGVPFSVPAADELPRRLGAILDAVYAAYGTGWDDAAGPGGRDDATSLVDEAVRLARLLVQLVPTGAEAHGLLALLLHSSARMPARRSPTGQFVPLGDQDVNRWSADQIAEAERHLARALALADVGPYQLHAAVQSVHNRRALTGSTDWPAVVRLYEGLLVLTPTVGVAVALAAARAGAADAGAALALLDEVPGDVADRYQPYWVARSHVLRTLGDTPGADAALRVAADLTSDPSVRTFLLTRPGPG